VLLFLAGFLLMFAGATGSSVYDAMRESGSSLFTLGSTATARPLATAVGFFAAATGLVVVALQIAYLPTLYGAFNRRETLVTQMHEMQSRLLAVADELETAIDDRDDTIGKAVSERTGTPPSITSPSRTSDPVDPRYEDLWAKDTPSVEIPDLEPMDLDFGEERPDRD